MSKNLNNVDESNQQMRLIRLHGCSNNVAIQTERGILKENICTLVHLKFKMTIKNKPDSKPVEKKSNSTLI